MLIVVLGQFIKKYGQVDGVSILVPLASFEFLAISMVLEADVLIDSSDIVDGHGKRLYIVESGVLLLLCVLLVIVRQVVKPVADLLICHAVHPLKIVILNHITQIVTIQWVIALWLQVAVDLDRLLGLQLLDLL